MFNRAYPYYELTKIESLPDISGNVAVVFDKDMKEEELRDTAERMDLAFMLADPACGEKARAVLANTKVKSFERLKLWELQRLRALQGQRKLPAVNRQEKMQRTSGSMTLMQCAVFS